MALKTSNKNRKKSKVTNNPIPEPNINPNIDILPVYFKLNKKNITITIAIILTILIFI